MACQLCELHTTASQLHSELMFRLQQYQHELIAGREKQAAECKERSEFVLGLIFSNMTAMNGMEHAEHSDQMFMPLDEGVKIQ